MNKDNKNNLTKLAENDPKKATTIIVIAFIGC